MAGVDEGVLGMVPGGRRVLLLPPHLALGERTEPPNMVSEPRRTPHAARRTPHATFRVSCVCMADTSTSTA